MSEKPKGDIGRRPDYVCSASRTDIGVCDIGSVPIVLKNSAVEAERLR
jgi:hypothetical protein